MILVKPSNVSADLATLPGPQCLTTIDSPTKDTPCAIPFKFNGKLKNGCTTETDPDGRFWCSTKVDDNLDHVGGQGFWGYCSDACPKLTISGNNC